MVSKKMVIQNPSGLHLKPATRLSREAEQCKSKVEILVDGKRINCKSILNIVSGALRHGDEITLCCTGESEEQDLAYMTDVIKNKLE